MGLVLALIGTCLKFLLNKASLLLPAEFFPMHHSDNISSCSEIRPGSTITVFKLASCSFLLCTLRPFQMELAPVWILQSPCARDRNSLWILGSLQTDWQDQRVSHSPVFIEPKQPSHRAGFMRKTPWLFPWALTKSVVFPCCHFWVRNSILLQLLFLPGSVTSLQQELSLEGSRSQSSATLWTEKIKSICTTVSLYCLLQNHCLRG